MPFGTNDEPVKSSFGANDEVVTTRFGANDEVVRQPAVKQPVVAKQAPAEKPFNAKEEIPAFTDLMGVGEESYAPASTEQKIAIKDLINDPDYFKIISDYKTARFNEPYKEGEDKQAYVEDFMGKMRYNEMNVLFGSLPELNWMKNNPEQAKTSALAKMVYEETAGVEQPGGQRGFQPYVDVVKALATDPLNYLGFFTGKGAGAVLSKTAMQPAMKQAAAGVVGAVTEGAIGGGANIVEQKTQMTGAEALGQQLTPEQKQLDKAQIAAATVLAGVMGGGEAAFGAKGVGRQSGKSLKEYLSKQRSALNTPTAPVTELEEELANKLVDEAEIKVYGQQVLRDLDPSTPLTDAQISRDMSKRAVRVAMKVIEVDPNFAFNPNTEKISTAIARVFSKLDEVDDVALESAINYAGLTPDQFAAANKMTVTDAAAIMQQYSVAARMVKRMQEIDPDFKARMDNIYGKNDSYVSPLGSVLEGIKWTEKQSKAFITSGLDTTIRNVAGTNIGLTMKAASDVIDGFLYTTGVALNKSKRIALGQSTDGISVRQAAADSVKNAFDTFFYMKNSGLAADVTDKLLENNPSIRNHMLAALQETDKKDVSKLARWANVFNAAQDTFFRRAVFTASVERQLRNQGIDLYKDVLANNKMVPSNILSKAADDSLKATFSYMPKPQRGASKGIESMAEGGANSIVRAIENTPFSSLAVPFPRFMANAMAFQYRYSPIGVMGAGEDLAKALSMRNTNPERAAELFRNARLKTAQAAVGTAGLMAAYEYRMENPDSKWYEVKINNGTTTDIRAVFPLGPYFAVADILARKKQGLPAKSKDAMEAIVGMKMPAGSQNVFVDRLLAMSEDSGKDADKWAVSVGKMLGDFVGRFTQPFVVKNFYDYYDLISEEGSKARDPNVIDVMGTPFEQGVQAATQRVQSKIPGLKEQLPEAIPRLREGPVVREGEFFNRLVGFRQVPNKTPVEREIDKLDIDPYRLYGGSSGDKEYDRAYTEEANKLVIDRIKGIIESPEYQKQSPLEQRIGLTDAVKEMTTIAREITKAKMTDKNMLGIYKMRFDKLPEEARMFINREYAKDHDGKTLEETRDYMMLDQYEGMLGAIRKYALGGAVGKALTKATLKKSAKELFKEMQESAVRQAVKTTDEVIPVQKAIPTPEATPEPTIAPAPEQVAAPVQAPKSLSKEGYKFSEADQFFNEFPEEELIKAENQIADKYGMSIEQMLSDHPQEFANELALQTQKNMGFKDKTFPYMDDEYDQTSAKMFSDIGIKSKKKIEQESTNPYTIAPEVKAAQEKQMAFSKKAMSGDLSEVYGVSDKDELIKQIREFRTDVFDEIRADPKYDMYDDKVLGVAQGEFRAQHGFEFDPMSGKATSDMFDDIVNKQQKRLDTLRKKYANTPDVPLFHGTSARTAETIKREGFAKPQADRRKHMEIGVGAPSFTKDLNLGFDKGEFGGSTPSNYLSSTMPYADYKFLRVNMSEEAYNKSDLNTIVRSISGDPNSARPLGLPMSRGFKETEDAFVEADKLRVKSAEDVVTSKMKRTQGKGKTYQQYLDNKKKLVDQFRVLNVGTIQSSPAEAQKAYNLVRDYLKNSTAKGRFTSTKTGIGQRYTSDIQELSSKYTSPDQLQIIADTLEKSGSKEKANLMRQVSDKMKELNGADTGREQIKVKDAIFKLTPKLAKGGLAARK